MSRYIAPSKSQQTQGRPFHLEEYLFDKQFEFVKDPSPFKVAVCSRRAGKTVACAADLVATALTCPGTTSLYITLSAANAKKLVWKELRQIEDKYRLGMKFNEVELSITFTNKSLIYLSGAKDKSEIEKFRGLALKLCYIDECQSFKAYIEELIDDVIAPALLDNAGTLCLIGTPGPVPSGYFHKCAHSEGWNKYKWTFFDNPMWPAVRSGEHTHQELLDRDLKRRGVSPQEPSIRREFYGEWILDSNALLIKYAETINDFSQIPQNHTYNYIMGIDVGFQDADALAILAYSDHDPTTYLVEEKITPKQGITELANQIQDLDKKYHVTKMIMDMGALGKKIGEELIKRYGIPVEAAEKQRKMESVEFLNDALRTGRFRAKRDSTFAQDTYRVEKDLDKSTPERIKVSDRFHSDIIDAVLYAFKFSPAYAWEPKKDKAKPGTKEWADEQTGKMFQSALDHFQAEASQQEELKKMWGDDF